MLEGKLFSRPRAKEKKEFDNAILLNGTNFKLQNSRLLTLAMFRSIHFVSMIASALVTAFQVVAG